MTDLLAGDLESFRAAFAGRVVTAQDADYDAVRADCVWNGNVNKRPWVIARAATAADVATAVSFARATGREVAVRGGGHSFAGQCTGDDTVMIDTGAINHVEVDPAARRVVCGGGTNWGQMDAATQAHGLAVTGGFISHTGVAGLTLGGGIGWLVPRAGLSCDCLVSAEIVTADGEIRRASRTENPDLFWAIRGGGGNFGVVTEFEFDLVEVGPLVRLGLSFWGADRGAEALRAARDLAPSLPDDVTMFIAGLNAPPAPFVPVEHQGALGYAVILVGTASDENHQDAVARLRAASKPLFAFDTPIPYTDLQHMFDEGNEFGVHSYDKGVWLEELTDEAIGVITTHFPRKSSPLTLMPVFVLTGAYGRHDEDDSAFSGSRRARYSVSMTATTPTAEGFAAERDWSRAFWSELVQHAAGVGHYVNFMSEVDDARVRAAYGAKYERLARTKADFDPDNVFHLNMNIRPAG